VQEERIPRFHQLGIALIEHRRIDPERGVYGAHAVAAGAHPVFAKAGGIEDFCMRLIDITHRSTGADHRFAGKECILTGLIHTEMLGMNDPYNQCSHHRRMVAAIGR